MIQADAPFSYDDGVEGSYPPATNAGRAAAELVEAFSTASRELAEATERFALDSMQALNSAVERSQQAATTSNEMAEAARAAATTAEAAAAHADAKSQELTSEGERLKSELSQQQQAILQDLAEATARSREALTAAHAAIAEATEATERLQTTLTTAQAAATEAQLAAAQAQEAAVRSEQSVLNIGHAASSAEEAAERSRQSASQAERTGPSSFAQEAGPLLERLETDYTLLTRLVQELHTRISHLGSVNTSGAPAQTYASPQPPPAQAATWPQATPSPNWTFGAHETPEPAASSQPVQPSDTPASSGLPVPPPIMLSGRVQTIVSPVPDFDRLLNLDGAIGRISTVQNVTLADYANDEVTFRIDFAGAVEATEFARCLAAEVNAETEILQASESALSLRIGR